MGFTDFARQHGLIVDNLIPHRWIATATEDHPRKKNGRYKWLGEGWLGSELGDHASTRHVAV